MGVFDFFKRKPQKSRMGRNYYGANQGRLFADFVAPANSADSTLRLALPVLRDRSRDLARNNEYAKRYLNLIKTSVVGERGFTLQVRARNDDRALDAPGNAIIENAFKSWGRLGNPEVSGRMSWLDCQRFVAETLARDGEVFIKKVQNRRLKDGFGIQFIESDLVDHDKNDSLENGNTIRMGVELNQFHKPVAYHVLTEHPNDLFYTASMQKREHIRVPAEEMIHIFMPGRSFQTRGEPFMAPVISNLKQLDGFIEAELVSARAAAAKFGIITTPNGDDFVGDDETDQGIPIIDFDPGSVHQLPRGHDFQMVEGHHNAAFDDFVKGVLRGIASGLNVSYTSLSNDLQGVSYSSIRQGTIDERDHMKLLQSFLIQHFCEPVFRSWLDSALDFGGIPIPRNKYDKFSDNIHFRGRGFAWVDPSREINANVAALQNGLISMNDVAANYGKDVEELFGQIQSDKEMAERFGLELAFEPFGGGQSPFGPAKFSPFDDSQVDDDDADN